MGCGESFVKYTLFIANIFFAVAGLALLGTGVTAQEKLSHTRHLIDGPYDLVPMGTMVVGGIVFLIAFFGCCGAIKESNCMLVTYSIFLILLVAVKIELAVLIYMNKDGMLKELGNAIEYLFSNDRNLFHNLEAALHCCGSTGSLSYGVTNMLSLPPSCCAAEICTAVNSFPGCIEVVKYYVNTFSQATGVGCLVVVSVEIVAMVFGLCLASHVRNKHRRMMP